VEEKDRFSLQDPNNIAKLHFTGTILLVVPAIGSIVEVNNVTAAGANHTVRKRTVVVLQIVVRMSGGNWEIRCAGSSLNQIYRFCGERLREGRKILQRRQKHFKKLRSTRLLFLARF
jgi:succinyl-CoA synthetase beta subunit